MVFAAFLLSSPDPVQLRVTVYDRSALDASTKASLFSATARVFRTAGINIIWIHGSIDSAEARLLPYPEAPRRGSEAEASCRARTDIALDLLGRGPDAFGRTILGMAQPFAAEGLNVRLFIDRVEMAASAMKLQMAIVAAHVLAHEIGHVLLRTNEHSASGVMAGPWTAHEYRRISAGELMFSPQQISTLHATLNRTGCVAQSVRAAQRSPAID